MNATKTEIGIGTTGFGQVNGYGPCRWVFDGFRRGAWVLRQVKPPSQSRAFPDQYVDVATVRRILDNDA